MRKDDLTHSHVNVCVSGNKVLSVAALIKYLSATNSCRRFLRGERMPDQRPNPDQLLSRVQTDEARARRGKLKIFFGYAAGVGKTYAMLEAARRERAEGVDVVVGYVEPHGRPETEALLQGLEVLPPRQVPYRGVKLREFDLDAALARRPRLILVDEL